MKRSYWFFFVMFVAIAGLISPHALQPAYAGETPLPKYTTFFTGKITAFDAPTGNITFTNRKGQSKSFVIPREAKVTIDGKAASFTQLTTGMFGGIFLDEKGTTIGVRAYIPKAEPAT